jgi:hypothetical protein
VIFDPPLNFRHFDFFSKNSINSALTKKIDSFLAKNIPSEESSGRRILQQRIFCPSKKITVAENSSAKNHPNEELSGEEFS